MRYCSIADSPDRTGGRLLSLHTYRSRPRAELRVHAAYRALGQVAVAPPVTSRRFRYALCTVSQAASAETPPIRRQQRPPLARRCWPGRPRHDRPAVRPARIAGVAAPPSPWLPNEPTMASASAISPARRLEAGQIFINAGEEGDTSTGSGPRPRPPQEDAGAHPGRGARQVRG